tara:strand:- start:2893 stop:3357 length:465 start_codon:yes stop_codon:yes gene_type:complete
MSSLNYAPLYEVWSHEPRSEKKKHKNKYEEPEFQKEYLKKNNQIVVEKEPVPLKNQEEMLSESRTILNSVPETSITQSSVKFEISDPWLVNILSKYSSEYQSQIIEQTLKAAFTTTTNSVEFFSNIGSQIDLVKLSAFLLIFIAIYDIFFRKFS